MVFLEALLILVGGHYRIFYSAAYDCFRDGSAVLYAGISYDCSDDCQEALLW